MSGFIRTTYTKVVPNEDDEIEPEVEDGWIDEEGVRLSPAQAITFLKREGATDPSSSAFHKGVWYSSEPYQDMYDGSDETRSYHLKNYTINQQRKIYDAVVNQKAFASTKRANRRSAARHSR